MHKRDQHLPHTVQHISFALSWSGCWLWPVECWSTPLLWLCEAAGYWQELEHAVIYADPEHPNMLNGWHVHWVCWPRKNWDVFSFQELCTDPCNMGPCIIMLQHEVMVVDEWYNNGPQDLNTVSLCIQNDHHLCILCAFKMTTIEQANIHNIRLPIQ